MNFGGFNTSSARGSGTLTGAMGEFAVFINNALGEEAVQEIKKEDPSLTLEECANRAQSIFEKAAVDLFGCNNSEKRDNVKKHLKENPSVKKAFSEERLKILNKTKVLLKASKIVKEPVYKLSYEDAQKIVSDYREAQINKKREHADKMMNSLLEEVEDNKKKRKSKRRNRKSKQKKFNPAKETAKIKPPSRSLSSHTTVKSQKQKKTGLWINRLNRYKASMKEMPRVKRWACKDVKIIRSFIDTIHGKQVQRYLDRPDDEIIRQRSYHYFPGIQKVFRNDKIKERYTFPTTRGLGLFVELKRNQNIETGILYFGIDKKMNSIFHRYFEPLKKSCAVEELFQDKESVLDKENIQESQDWKIQGSCQFVLKKDGCLKVSFRDEEHELTIYPVFENKIV